MIKLPRFANEYANYLKKLAEKRGDAGKNVERIDKVLSLTKRGYITVNECMLEMSAISKDI